MSATVSATPGPKQPHNQADTFEKKFITALTERHAGYRRGQRFWSFVHHSTLYTSVVASAAAAVLPQLQGFDGVWQKNWTSILAGAAALLISLGTSGGFARKWRANRMSRSKTEKLLGELIGRNPTRADNARFVQINLDHDKAIVGD